MLSRLAVAADLAGVEVRMAALRLVAWLAGLQLELEAWLRGGGGAEQRAALAGA